MTDKQADLHRAFLRACKLPEPPPDELRGLFALALAEVFAEQQAFVLGTYGDSTTASREHAEIERALNVLFGWNNRLSTVSAAEPNDYPHKLTLHLAGLADGKSFASYLHERFRDAYGPNASETLALAHAFMEDLTGLDAEKVLRGYPALPEPLAAAATRSIIMLLSVHAARSAMPLTREELFPRDPLDALVACLPGYVVVHRYATYSTGNRKWTCLTA